MVVQDELVYQRQQSSIVDAFLSLLQAKGSMLRGFLNKLELPDAAAYETQVAKPFVVAYGIPVGTLLSVRFGNRTRCQRWGTERAGIRNAHEEFKKIEGYPKALPWLLRMDLTTTLGDIMELIPEYVIEQMGACRVEMSLLMQSLSPQTCILPRNVVGLQRIRKDFQHAHACVAKGLVVKQVLLGLKETNKMLLAERKLLAESAQAQRMEDKALSPQQKKEKKKKLQAEAGQQSPVKPARKPLTRAEMQSEADRIGVHAFKAYLKRHSMEDVLVVQKGCAFVPFLFILSLATFSLSLSLSLS